MTLKSWIVVSKCTYMWNCFSLTCNSPVNSYPHVSSGCNSESQVLLVLLGNVTHRWDVRNVVFPIRSSALLITMALISWSKYSFFLRFFPRRT
jgi:hypothetical protein